LHSAIAAENLATQTLKITKVAENPFYSHSTDGDTTPTWGGGLPLPDYR